LQRQREVAEVLHAGPSVLKGLRFRVSKGLGTWVADAGPSVGALLQRQREVAEVLQAPPPALLRRQHAAVRHTCAHIRIRQHTPAYVGILTCQHTPAFGTPAHTYAYVSIRQHTSAYASILHTCAHTFSSRKKP
jgi:hypothetical protein